MAKIFSAIFSEVKAKKKIIVSVTNDLFTDQRVHKVCTFLHENNYDVLLVGRKLSSSQELAPRDYATKRFRLWWEKGAFFYAHYNVRLFFFLLFQRADVFLSNDLDTLLANYCAQRFKRNTELVYDTHELFTEVPELIDRPRVRRVWLAIERWIFPKLKYVYTVNQSIADIYQERYAIPVRVVRNVSKKWTPTSVPSKSELGLPEDTPLIILQGAGINIDRGGEEAVEAMKYLTTAVLIFVGSGDVIPQLQQRVKEDGLEKRVLFFGRKPYLEMMQYTYHADLGLTLDKDSNANYRYSLPNKVFDYIHAQTPIVASNLVEVRRVVEEHQVGVIIPSHDPKMLAQTIQNLLNDHDQLRQLKENCLRAAKTECWEKEEQVLRSIYS